MKLDGRNRPAMLTVCEALKATTTTLPVRLRRSLTWDQGKEMTEHRRFSIETGVEVYFCDPRSPCAARVQ